MNRRIDMENLNMSARSGRIGIVGGGLGGLASAVVLAARGYDVTLWDKNAWLGGKAAILEEGGYRFDMGPTILLMPSVLKRIFAEAGLELSDRLDLIPLDPQWRSFFSDGSTLDLHADIAAMKRELKAFAPESSAAEGYASFLELSDRLRKISDKFFFWRPIGSVMDMFDPKTTFQASMLADVLRMRPWSTVAATVRSFVSEPRAAQMLDHFTQYVGSAPDLSPAILCSIAQMQTGEGVWYPKGGTRAVPLALLELARELGVEIHSNTLIRKILIDESTRRAAGVETAEGERIELAAVVSNADSVRTHRELLPEKIARPFLRRRGYEPACSGVVLYLGLSKRYEHLLHHNFVFSADPHAEFRAIYDRGEPAADPTCYLCAPAATEPEVAPEGGEALYVLVHTPYLRRGHDWNEMFPRYRDVIIDKLKRHGGMADIEERIRVERYLTPEDIHRRYGVLDGAIYGLASHGRWGGAFKPVNRSPDVSGLYLAGGSAHPGPGMPPSLMSGWIAADALDRDAIVAPARDRAVRQVQTV
jgi:diapolycopene oxygenase